MTMIPTHYSINVSRADIKPSWDGKPVYRYQFTVEPSQTYTKNEAQQLLQELSERFPKIERWKLTLDHIVCSGTTVEEI